ncbi:MAG: AAA family ATPase, partial [Planctomycetes bacterium]|nr:AAA family ATPase [Planctomycetota bacterium]
IKSTINVSGNTAHEDLRLRQLLEKLDLSLDGNGKLGLGSNNLLFMACEFLLLAQEDEGSKLLLIEEPEAHLHAQRQLRAMRFLQEEAEEKGIQIIVTTHSPEFLDQVRLQEDALFVVVSRQGTTEIAMADQASRRAIKDHLYSPGHLQRMDQLAPDETDLERQRQMVLFDLAEEEP